MTEYKTATGGNANTKVAFKNCTPFRSCVININNEHVETAENLNMIMPMYNLLEYSDNYAEFSVSLRQFKRDKQNLNNNGDIDDFATADSSYFKYKSSAAGALNGVKIAVPVKYVSNFFRSLEMLLINWKIHFELNWTKDCVMSSIAGATTFQITSTKLYVYHLRIK